MGHATLVKGCPDSHANRSFALLAFVISVSNTDVSSSKKKKKSITDVRFRLDTFRAQFYIRVSGDPVNWTKIGGLLLASVHHFLSFFIIF